MSTEAKIRDEEQYGLDYFDLKIISPTKGKHTFAHCQVLYQEVHAFLNKKEVGTNQDRHRSSRNHMDRALCTIRPNGKQKCRRAAPQKTGSYKESRNKQPEELGVREVKS